MAKLSGWLLFTPERPMIAMYKMARSFQPSFLYLRYKIVAYTYG